MPQYFHIVENFKFRDETHLISIKMKVIAFYMYQMFHKFTRNSYTERNEK